MTYYPDYEIVHRDAGRPEEPSLIHVGKVYIMPRHDDLTRAVCPDCGYTLFIASPWTKLGTPICPQCYLSCQVAETTCFVCNGTGQKRLHVFGVRTNFVTCDRCDGTGTLREAGAA